MRSAAPARDAATCVHCVCALRSASRQRSPMPVRSRSIAKGRAIARATAVRDAAALTEAQAIERARTLLPDGYCGPTTFVSGCDVIAEHAFELVAHLLPSVSLSRRQRDWGGLTHTYVVLDPIGNCDANIPGTEQGAPRCTAVDVAVAIANVVGVACVCDRAVRRRRPPHPDSTSSTRFSKGTQTAQGAFRQVVANRDGRTTQTTSGTFAFARPGKFRWTLRQAVRAADRRRWRQGLGLRPRSQPGDRAQARRGARRDARGAARRRQRAREELHARRDGGEGDGLEYVDATPKAADSQFKRIRLGFATTCRARWS